MWAAIPEIGNRDELEIQFLGVFLKGGNQRAFHAVATADDTHPNSIVGAGNGGVAACVPGDGGSREGGAAGLQKLPAICVGDCHRCGFSGWWNAALSA